MDRYHIIKQVGEGSFGRVYQAIDHLTGQYVAIKELKPNCHPMSCLPEVRALQILQHPKIVGFKGAERQHNTVFLVFEYMDGSLRHLINHRLRMGGLDFMHRNRRFMHRDLKPENLLVNKHGVVKISDLGSATEIESDDSLFHHHYVTTRSYRAPEMLLRMFLKNEKLRPFEYDEKVDMWAVGVIIAELHLMRPLFRGRNSEHQLHEICRVIGAPTWESWMNWPKLEPEKGFGFRALMPSASESALDLIESLCSWDPSNRPSAAEALRHPFFTRGRNVLAPPPGFSRCPRPVMKYVVNKNVPNMTSMQPIY
ncbi:hypothetical protein ACLB2K_052462 [Fragaria x ananassa]